MKKLKYICSVLLVAAMCFGSTACSGDHTEAFIYFELNSIPATLDPQLVKTTDEITVVRSLYDGLMRYDTEGNCVPSAAERYEKNGLTYTFYINNDAAWTNGDKLMAQDFVFAFRRALSPETKAPFAAALSAVKNAEAVLNGQALPDSLGITAADDYTLVIELSYDDPDFLNTLTTPVTMPCNEEFFNSCKGKYGLSLDTVLCNGSYYVKKWTTEDSFLIRLAKNLNFKGPFEANSMRVYFTCDDSDNAVMVSETHADAALIDANDYEAASQLGLQLISEEDTCYMLFISDSLSENLRKSFLQAIDTDALNQNYTAGYRKAGSIYPDSLKTEGINDVQSFISYNIESAAALYNKEVLAATDKKLPEIVLQYYDNSTAETTAKAMAAHWQQKLGAFINIEKITSQSRANSLWSSGSYTMILLPFSASCGCLSAYQSQFGITERDPHAAQNELISDYTCIPLFFSCNYITAGKSVINLEQTVTNGIPDIALMIKHE